MSFKKNYKKVYNFIFNDDSVWSWIVNILLAFVIVKFLIYPGLGLVLGTDYPMVAVISGSMEHNGLNFDQWWDENGQWYIDHGISRVDFEDYIIHNGFNKGDVIILRGKQDYSLGDIVVYQSSFASYPVIHRVTYINDSENTLIVKGDNNDSPDPYDVDYDLIEGVAAFKIPYIGWVKILFTELTGI